MLLAGAIEVNALAQGALRQFTQWLWIEHPTFQLGDGHFTTELIRIGFGETWLLQTRNGYLTTYLVRARGGQRQCCNVVLAQELMKHVVIFSVNHVGRKHVGRLMQVL